MKAARILKTTVGYLWRLGLCAGVYAAGAMIGGALVSALGLPLPEVPDQASAETTGLLMLVAAFALAAGLVPLVRRLGGPCRLRWLTLSAMVYICIGVTSPLEGAIFTTMDMTSVPVLSLAPCLLFAAAMVLLFKPVDMSGEPAVSVRRFFGGRSAGQWAWRLVAAACAFPVIYWTFGLMVAPFVMEYYRQGQFALAIPNPGVILLTQLLRGVLFLAAALPILMTWSGSRRRLILSLGLAFYVLVGLFGMIQSYWLAPVLQVLHNTEMLADSMVYAVVLAWLLTRREQADADERFTRYLLCVGQVSSMN